VTGGVVQTDLLQRVDCIGVDGTLGLSQCSERRKKLFGPLWAGKQERWDRNSRGEAASRDGGGGKGGNRMGKNTLGKLHWGLY